MLQGFDTADFYKLLHSDSYLIDILRTVRNHLPYAYVAAGFIRNRVWDDFYNQNGMYPDQDIDIVYFNSDNTAPDSDYELENILQRQLKAPWQVRNQARMHSVGNYPPFKDIEHALSHWPETATAIGLRLRPDDTFDCIAPFGFDDLFDHVLRITPAMLHYNPEVFRKRLSNKKWHTRWPNIKVIDH